MLVRDGSRAVATSKMEHFAIIVNCFQPLTIITKRSILDVAATLDLLLLVLFTFLVNGEYGFTSLWGVDAILGDGYET